MEPRIDFRPSQENADKKDKADRKKTNHSFTGTAKRLTPRSVCHPVGSGKNDTPLRDRRPQHKIDIIDLPGSLRVPQGKGGRERDGSKHNERPKRIADSLRKFLRREYHR